MKKIFLGIIVLLISVLAAHAAENEPPILKITLLNQNPSPARAGDTVEVRLRVENVGGGTVNNLELEMLQVYPFTVIDGQPLQKIGTLYAYQSNKNYVNVGYRLRIDKDAVKGKHELKVKHRHDNEDWVTSSFNIDVTSKEFAQIIYVDKAKLDPGKETEMKFTITNIGNAPLQNMVFSWSEPGGVILPVFSDDTKYIKYLNVRDSIELAYTVIADVNAKPGLYHLDLSLKYESTTDAASALIKTKAGIFVGGETDFDVAFSESSQGQTSLSVSNTGNNPALSVSVKIPEQSGFKIIGSTSAIVGNLDKGDYTIVSFQIVPNAMATSGPQSKQSSNNNLKVIIDYTDTTGERRSVEKNAAIQFKSSTDSQASVQSGTKEKSFWQSNAFYASAIIIVLALVFVLYRKKGIFKKK